MTTLTIEIPEKVEKTLSDPVEQLGGKVVSTDNVRKLSKAAKKNKYWMTLRNQ
ncbi:hypothetical protein [Mucilaginibacter sp.]|uniref:hypothetical protein n=1 Tax=Mucilaginibacter sp. TaxID=1882438 RepID=UPI002848D300|nr:hypothetical protein [Mucilaginibacter sp.]MDR3695153.1 hypothetical protein [Mucilaginibacter sp.]